MSSGTGVTVFFKALALVLVLNLVTQAALGLWSSYFVAALGSVGIAAGVWLGQVLRTARDQRR